MIDDQIDNIEVLDSILADDYRVLFATNATDALRLSQEQRPDLILLDVVMPDMDGYELCTRLRQNPATRDIPVIFVTARDQDDDEAIGLRRGAVDYLTKPLNPVIVRLRV
ncbi:MAG: response regulator, partial [Candidatus Competibacteraceae bacterium]|nr:response regulator [Candidatus Competibacteraceae bacterium]